MPWLQTEDGSGWTEISDEEFGHLNAFRVGPTDTYIWVERIQTSTRMPRLGPHNHARPLLSIHDDASYQCRHREDHEHNTCTRGDAFAWFHGESVYVPGEGWRPAKPGPPDPNPFDPFF